MVEGRTEYRGLGSASGTGRGGKEGRGALRDCAAEGKEQEPERVGM